MFELRFKYFYSKAWIRGCRLVEPRVWCIPWTDETCRFRTFHLRKVVPITKQASDIKSMRKKQLFCVS